MTCGLTVHQQKNKTGRIENVRDSGDFSIVDGPVRGRPKFVHEYFDQRRQAQLPPFDTQGKSCSLLVANPPVICIQT